MREWKPVKGITFENNDSTVEYSKSCGVRITVRMKSGTYGECLNCNSKVTGSDHECPNCGYKLDWTGYTERRVTGGY